MYKKIIEKMTLEEKCAILSGKDVWHTRAISRLDVPAITLSDGPSGLRKQADEGDHLGLNASAKATCMPSASTVANSWDVKIAEIAGKVIGSEAAMQDVQVVLGPGLNIKRSPLCGRNFEYYSEDPYLSGKMAAAFIRGVQENGAAACPKHFAVNSQETNRMANDSVLDERTLRELYLTNFEIAVKEGKPRVVMSSYNLVNGVYANENKHLLDDILRREWGFEGAVVTDWGGGNDYVEGVRTGCNLEMPGSGDDSACQLIEAVRQGRIAETLVDERVHQLLELVMTASERKQDVSASFEENHQLALKAAEESIVLLKNEGNILPIAKNAKIAAIGNFIRTPRCQGSGSSLVNPAMEENGLEMLRHVFQNEFRYAEGFRRLDEPDGELLARAEEIAAHSDCVLLYLGLPEGFETEGLDREHMRIPDNQRVLLERLHQVNPRIIVVMSAGSAVEMPWIDQCQALLWAGLGGQASAEAVLRVLTGEVNPSGKLSETFPVTYERTAISRYYPGKEKTSEYREGVYVGYRLYETADLPVRFPFGFGLSYTSFEYANMDVSDAQISFEITNTGECAGAEVAQLYVSLPDATVFRPKMELKGFVKVHLEAGETKRVRIRLDDKTFRYFNVKTNRFEVEGGRYRLMVGASVQDIRLTDSLVVQGTGACNPYEGKDLGCYEVCDLNNVPDDQFCALLGREIPPRNWDRSAPLQMNDAVSQLFYARNPIARFACRIVSDMKNKSIAEGKPDLNLLFIYNITFRGIAKMMNGMVSMEMAEAILFMVNGHGFRGLGRLIKAFFRRPNLNRKNKI
ncbi:MAG TPA: glycoside hydrolase family 3 C-terminal domain-containing protein [Clostridia bacterium]|nr:glycoside hydrolase family 3 C-terminal domain-containing protein [Clostridia bacterium]